MSTDQTHYNSKLSLMKGMLLAAATTSSVVAFAPLHPTRTQDPKDTLVSLHSSRQRAVSSLSATTQEEDGVVLGQKYLLSDDASPSTSGKSTLVEATPQDAPPSTTSKNMGWGTHHGFPNQNAADEAERLVVKFSDNIKALKREVKNYDRVTNEDTKDLFVEIHDFYNPSADATAEPVGDNPADDATTPVFKGQAALVMERGEKDLQSYLQENGPLRGEQLREAVATTARAVKACHDQNMVWTELKATNFVVQHDPGTANASPHHAPHSNYSPISPQHTGSSSTSPPPSTAIKAIDLESAVQQGQPPIDFSPEAIPPEFALAFLCGREPYMEMHPTFDIFSLGLLWYELATGRQYWQVELDEPDPGQVQIVNELRTRSVMEINHAATAHTMEKPMKDLIAQCLRVDPAERPTIDELLQHPYLAGAI